MQKLHSDKPLPVPPDSGFRASPSLQRECRNWQETCTLFLCFCTSGCMVCVCDFTLFPQQCAWGSACVGRTRFLSSCSGVVSMARAPHAAANWSLVTVAQHVPRAAAENILVCVTINMHEGAWRQAASRVTATSKCPLVLQKSGPYPRPSTECEGPDRKLPALWQPQAPPHGWVHFVSSTNEVGHVLICLSHLCYVSVFLSPWGCFSFLTKPFWVLHLLGVHHTLVLALSVPISEYFFRISYQKWS